MDKNLILKLLDQIKNKNIAVKNIGKDYYGVAILGEIASLTPENIRLLKVSATLGEPPAKKPRA